MIEDRVASLLKRNRRDVRQLTVLIIGRVVGAHGEYACVVKNVSRHGLKARFPRPPAVGERLTFAFRCALELAATVRWVDGNEAGVEFDQPFDLTAILENYGAARMPRPPRFACNRLTRVTICGSDHAAEILDVSLGGAKLSVPSALLKTPGGAGTLLLPVVEEPRAGTLRWEDGNRFGFQFAKPLTIDTLAKLLSNMPTTAQ